MNKTEIVSRLLRYLSSIMPRTLGPHYPKLRRLLRFLAWCFPSLNKLLSTPTSKERRLLVIYDTFTQPFSIGDILIMQAVSLILREQLELGKVDFALVYNPKQPAVNDPAFTRITEENALYHLASILPVAQINQYLGSVFIFDDHAQIHRFIVDNHDFYQIWPSGWQFASRDYLYYTMLNGVIYDYFQKNRQIPSLTCRPFLTQWANSFYHEQVSPLIPVTVNVRNNKNHGTNRNLNLDAWLNFFKHCESCFPVKFVIICALVEIDERLRHCPNVLIAKDFHTSVEQDLALIHAAAMHLGAPSGPASMAWFNHKPYLMVNTVYHYGYFAHDDMVIQEEDGIQRFCFATPFQRIAAGMETTELLINEFTRLWQAVDIEAWQSPDYLGTDSADSGLQSWLR